MFASSGYFKGVNCPYYASGLCERSYCHFRHVRNDAQAKRNAVNSTSHVNTLQTGIGGVESVKRNGLGAQPSLLGMVGNAIKQVQRDIEKDKAVIQHLQPSCKPGIPNYSPTPIDPPSVKTVTQKKQPVSATYLPPGIPAYKPTPIHLLQRKKPTVKSHIEYDPLSNSSLSERITLADAEQKIAAKQEVVHPEFCPGKVIKTEKSEVNEEEIQAKFSSDDEGLTDNASNNDLKSNKDKEETTKKDSAINSERINDQQKNDNKESVTDSLTIKKEKNNSGLECDKGFEPLKKDLVVIGQEVSKEEKEITLDKNKHDTQTECPTTCGPNEQVSKHDKSSMERTRDISDTDRLESHDQPENDGHHLGDEKERMSKNDERKKDRDSHKYGKHKSSRELSHHHHRHSEENHRHRSSEKARDKHHRHDSHSSSSRHKHSRSSKHGHVDKKLRDHHKSKEDHHRIKDHSRRHRHRKSAKSYSRSHHSRKKSKSSHKYRKSDRHHHHHHHRRESLSKSSSSKRKHRHSSLSGDSSYSSISSFSSSSSSGSSSDWSDVSSSSQRSDESQLSASHKRHRSLSSGSCPDKKVATSSQHPESSKSSLSSDKTNVFEKFQRTVSCVDLFGEDSSESDSGKQVTAKARNSESSKHVVLVSDDDNDGDHDDSGRSGNSSLMMDMSVCNKEETGKCQTGMKRKFEENDNDDKDTREMKTDDVQPVAEDDSLPIIKKRRLAHTANPDAFIKRRVPPIAPHRPSPAQVMLNRFKEIQKAREAAEPKTEISGSSNEKPTQEVSDLSEKKRIAHSVQGLKQGLSLMKNRPGAAKLTLDRISNNAQPDMHSTKAGTIAKGSSRQAHVPNQKMLKRPIIPADGGSKVATSIRQRYLNLFVDECLKIYPQAKDAYDRALLEEKSVCARASNKKIYLNVAINTLKKLRDEVIRSSDSSDQELKSPTKNPLTLSHAAVLGGARAASTKFTLKRSGGQVKLPAHLTSRQLYILLSRYILTEDQLVDNGFPRPVPGEPGKAKLQTPDRMKHMPLNSTEKNCTRCGKRFFVSVDGVYVTQENCVYHWGKCWKRRIAGSLENRYTCCEGDTESPGCQLSPFHVHEQNKYKDLTGYVQTRPISPPPDGDYKLYAMDCEMVYTRGGCELARVTVIDTNLQSVYEAIVRPENEVLDYNTRFSGLTADDMKGVTTTLSDVQAKLLSMFNDKTILIGHSLESDFIALKLLHKTVVDTSVVFPHKLGPPYKRALRTLMAEILQKIIQNDVGGHDSKEDAAACMELMIWKAKGDAKKALRS